MVRKLYEPDADPASKRFRSQAGNDGQRSPRPHRPGIRLAVAVVVFGLAVLLFLLLRPKPASGPTLVLPRQTGLLKPELLSLIERHADAVRANPNDPRARAMLGLVYEANKLWTEALECYEQAQDLQPEEPMWVHHAAIAAQTLGDYDKALRYLQQGADRFPEFAPIHHRLGDVLLGQNQLAAAGRAFERTIRITPQQCAGYVGLADVKLRQRAYEEAAALLERAVSLSPNYGPAHHLLGLAYRGLGRIEDAERHLARGANAKKQYLVDAWGVKKADLVVSIFERVDVAARLLAAGRVNEAIAKLEALLVSRPEEPRVMRVLGPAYIRAGRLQDARDILVRAKSVDATDLENYLSLAWCYRRMKRMEEALREADIAVERFPDAWAAYFARALALKGTGRADEAYESLMTAVGLNAADPAVYMTAGYIAERLQRFEPALLHYRTAADRWPEYSLASVRLAQLHMRLGHWDEAEAVIQAALRRAPSDANLLVLQQRLAEQRRR